MKRLIGFLLMISGVMQGQTIAPNQIRPSATNGQVLTTTAGVTAWSNVTPSAGYVVTAPTATQTITQPAGTTLSVNGLPVVAGTSSWPGLTAFGDSICAYTGSTSNATAFISLLANQTGGLLNNTCIGGYWIQDEIMEMYLAGTAGWNGTTVQQPTQGNNPLNTEEAGRNDADTCNADANCDATSGLALNAIIAHRASNNWVKVSSCSQAGTWANDAGLVNSANGTQALAATTVGASLTCTVTTYGSNGAIQVPARAWTSNTATATVAIDGGSPTTITATGVGGSSIIVGSRTTVLGYMFPVSAGTHTVVITTATGTSSGNPISIPDLVGNPNPSSQYTSAPYLGVMEVIPEQGNINPTWTTSINATKQAAVTMMAGYGYNVQWLPITNVPCTNGVAGCLGGFNNSTYISNQPSAYNPDGLSCAGGTSDAVHPNNCGHQQIFQAIQKDLNIVQASSDTPLNSWCVANLSLVTVVTTSYSVVNNQCTVYSNSSAGVFLPTLPTGQHIRVVNINSTGGASVPVYTAIGLANPIPPGYTETFDNYGADWFWTGGMPYEVPGTFIAHGSLQGVGGIYAGSALQFQVDGSGNVQAPNGVFTGQLQVGFSGIPNYALFSETAISPLTSSTLNSILLTPITNSAETGAIQGVVSSPGICASCTPSNVVGFNSSFAISAGGSVGRYTGFLDARAKAHAATNNATLADSLSYTGNWFINQSGTDTSLFSGLVDIGNATTLSSSASLLVGVSGGQTLEIQGTNTANSRAAFTFSGNYGSTRTSNFEFGTDINLNGQKSFYIYDYSTAQAALQIAPTTDNVTLAGSLTTPSAVIGTSATVAGSQVCRADGVNCPTVFGVQPHYWHIPALNPGTLLGPVYYALDGAVISSSSLFAVRQQGGILCSGSSPVISLMDLGTSPSTTLSGATTVILLSTGTSDGMYSNLSGSFTTTTGHWYGLSAMTDTTSCTTYPMFDVTIYF